jgi:hypothetical protein
MAIITSEGYFSDFRGGAFAFARNYCGIQARKLTLGRIKNQIGPTRRGNCKKTLKIIAFNNDMWFHREEVCLILNAKNWFLIND